MVINLISKKKFSMLFYLKVEVTKYEELEEVHAELKLKQLLWDSIDEWDKTNDEWMAVRLYCFIYSW